MKPHRSTQLRKPKQQVNIFDVFFSILLMAIIRLMLLRLTGLHFGPGLTKYWAKGY
jgi:hypothetical protein